jgi:hypothetical protein
MSNIDPTVPVYGTPTTQSVRNNFQIAHDEITTLQQVVTGGPFLPLAGGTLTGALTVDAALVATGTVSGNNVIGINPTTGNTNTTLWMGAATGGTNQIEALVNGNNRWLIFFSRNAETGVGNAGSDLAIVNFTDAGTYIGDAFRLTRATSAATFAGSLTTVGGANIQGPASFGSTVALAADPTAALQAVTKQYSDIRLTSGGYNVSAGGTFTLTATQAAYALLYLYGSPPAAMTVVLPVAASPRISWIVENATSPGQTITLAGVSGGTVAVPPGACITVWTDTAGIYSVNTDATTQAPGTNNTRIATTAFVHNYLPLAGGTLTGNLTAPQVIGTATAGGTNSGLRTAGALGFTLTGQPADENIADFLSTSTAFNLRFVNDAQTNFSVPIQFNRSGYQCTQINFFSQIVVGSGGTSPPIRWTGNTTIKPVADGGGALGWNYTQGGGEVDFFNLYTGVDAFHWYANTGSDTFAQIMSLSQSGGLTIPGGITAVNSVQINGSPAATLMLNATTGANQIRVNVNGVSRWNAFFSRNAETGTGNAGSDFVLASYDDTGTYLGDQFTILRNGTSGNIAVPFTFLKPLTVSQLATFVGGIHCTDTTASTVADLSHHINLFGGVYGFSVTAGFLNVQSGGNIAFYPSGSKVLELDTGIAAVTGSLGVSTAVPGDSVLGNVFSEGYYMPAGNLGFNAYNATSGWKRLAAAQSGLFTFDTTNNVWNWFCGPTGAAGGPITWTQVASMDHIGNLSLVTGGLYAPHGVIAGNGAAINDPLTVAVAQGYSARTMYTVANVREWSCGVVPSGNFAIADESGAATILQLFAGGGGQLTGTLACTGALTCSSMSGGVGGGGTLATTNGHAIVFGWATQYTNTITAYVDSTSSAYALCTQNNAQVFGYVGGTGGPTTITLNGQDLNGTLYGIYVDAVSDARIKQNIAPTEVDALATLLNIPVTQFDIKAEAAAWLGAVGQTPERQREAVRAPDIAPAHVAIGMVAQEVQQVIPEAVNVLVNPDPPEGSPLPPDMHTLIDASFTPYLVRAIQQLTARVAALEGAR